MSAAWRLINGTRRREHISPVLASLHWLPVKYRSDFKILFFAFYALLALAPGYIAELLILFCTLRPLRSADQSLLSIPHSRFKTRGDRAFSVVGPNLSNSLPQIVRSSPPIETFKNHQKIISTFWNIKQMLERFMWASFPLPRHGETPPCWLNNVP